MPLFGKSKKAQDAKKQEEASAPKPAPYRHVPKHAGSDARNHGLSESDRTAQQKRIMAASQSRLNRMDSNYSVKSNFNEVPINGSQSKPYFFSASNSPRHSVGSAKGKDRLAVQPGSPAGPVQPSQKAKDEYSKLPRNPSLLSNITIPENSTPKPILAVKNNTPAGGTRSTDSGYAGKTARFDSKAPSTISRAPSEPRTSQDVGSVPQSSTGLDFLPKLDFTPESSRPTTSSEQAASPILPKSPSSFASRDRATSSSSSYVSRLDPGSDRRSVASFQSKPFDQIDFSRPGQQFVPPSSTANNRREPEQTPIAQPERPAIQREATPPQPVRELKKSRGVPESIGLQRVTRKEIPVQPDRPSEVVPQPTQREIPVQPDRPSEVVPQPTQRETPVQPERLREVVSQPTRRDIPIQPDRPIEVVPESTRSIESPPETARHTVSNAAPVEETAEPSNADDGGPQLMPDQMTNQKVADAPTPVHQEGRVAQPQTRQPEQTQAQRGALPFLHEDKIVQPQTRQPEQTQSQLSNPADDERGRRTPQPVTAPVPASEQASRTASSSRTRHSEDTKPRSTRARNWSRPSQASGSQLDNARKESNAGTSDAWAQPTVPVSWEQAGQREVSRPRETGFDARDFSRTEQVQPNTRSLHSEAQQPYRWNDQASSIYGDSSYNPSTRQHSPSRRHSFAPSELLEVAHPAGRAALPPLSILDGLKVNKRGKILDEEGDVIGELVEGDIIDCVRQKANAFGQVCDDYGRIVGQITTVSRGGDTMRSRGFSDFRQDPMQQRYAMPEAQLVSPSTPTLARPFEYTQQEEDPRERAAKLQAAAARRTSREPVAQIELDGSGYAEAAPLVDHSEIFAPPFIPSRSPKRSPAEPAPHSMDYYFAKPQEKSQPLEEATPRLKKWASRNLEPEREEMQNSRQEQPPLAAQPPSEHTVSRPSTGEATPTEQKAAFFQNEPDTAAQSFIASDQPKDIFPWMTTPPASQENSKWNPSLFTYKDRGEVSNENPNSRQPAAVVSRMGAPSQNQSAPSQNQSAFAGNSVTPKQYMAHLAPATGGSRKSKPTSFQHQPLVKSPLSTHNVTPPDTSDGLPAVDDDTTPNANPSSEQMKKKTYFTHAGRTSVMVPDTTPTHTTPTRTTSSQAVPNMPKSSTATEPPPSPLDPAVPPDVVRTRGDSGKKKSRWSMSFGKKTPPVQNLLKKG